jgi:hypothetical protein
MLNVPLQGSGCTPCTKSFLELTKDKWKKRHLPLISYFNQCVEMLLSYIVFLSPKALEDNRGKLVKVSKDEGTGKKKVTGQKKELQESEHLS